MTNRDNDQQQPGDDEDWEGRKGDLSTSWHSLLQTIQVAHTTHRHRTRSWVHLSRGSRNCDWCLEKVLSWTTNGDSVGQPYDTRKTLILKLSGCTNSSENHIPFDANNLVLDFLRYLVSP